MNTIIRGLPISHSAVNIGVLEAPDEIGRCAKLTDAELERRYHVALNDVKSKEKHISFEDKKKTPPMVKFIVGGGLLYYLWHKIKGVFKK